MYACRTRLDFSEFVEERRTPIEFRRSVLFRGKIPTISLRGSGRKQRGRKKKLVDTKENASVVRYVEAQLLIKKVPCDERHIIVCDCESSGTLFGC